MEDAMRARLLSLFSFPFKGKAGMGMGLLAAWVRSKGKPTPFQPSP
jgi:hypothetical protein